MKIKHIKHTRPTATSSGNVPQKMWCGSALFNMTESKLVGGVEKDYLFKRLWCNKTFLCSW